VYVWLQSLVVSYDSSLPPTPTEPTESKPDDRKVFNTVACLHNALDTFPQIRAGTAATRPAPAPHPRRSGILFCHFFSYSPTYSRAERKFIIISAVLLSLSCGYSGGGDAAASDRDPVHLRRSWCFGGISCNFISSWYFYFFFGFFHAIMSWYIHQMFINHAL
jgi:hypothetical protein